MPGSGGGAAMQRMPDERNRECPALARVINDNGVIAGLMRVAQC